MRPPRQGSEYVVSGNEPSVLLLGNFGTGNYGNDASLVAVRDAITRQRPGASVKAVCPNPEIVRNRLGIDSIPLRIARPTLSRVPSAFRRLGLMSYRLGDLVHVVRTTKGVDALMVPGTGILDDFGGERARGWPLTLALWSTIARLRGVRVGLVSVGAGPLSGYPARTLARRVAATAHYQSYRDLPSQSFMTELGVPERAAHLVPDVVFSLDVDSSTEPPPTTPVVVVAVMNYTGWRPSAASAEIVRRYEAGLTEFVLWLLQRGYAVRLLSADGGDWEAVERVDAAARRAARGASSTLTSVRSSDFQDAARLIQNAYAVVATRYHSLVAGLAQGIPAISLGYADKNDDLMRRVGLPEFCQDAEEIDGRRLRQQFVELEQRHGELLISIRRATTRMRSDLNAQEEDLVKLIGALEPLAAEATTG